MAQQQSETERILINNAEEIGRRLKIARELNKMTLEKVSEIAPISLSHIGKIEKGIGCSLFVIDQLCVAYNVLPESILFNHLEVKRVFYQNCDRNDQGGKSIGLKNAVSKLRRKFSSALTST